MSITSTMNVRLASDTTEIAIQDASGNVIATIDVSEKVWEGKTSHTFIGRGTNVELVNESNESLNTYIYNNFAAGAANDTTMVVREVVSYIPWPQLSDEQIKAIEAIVASNTVDPIIPGFGDND